MTIRWATTREWQTTRRNNPKNGAQPLHRTDEDCITACNTCDVLRIRPTLFETVRSEFRGKVSALQRGEGGQILVTLAIEFAREPIEIVDDFFFRQSIQA